MAMAASMITHNESTAVPTPHSSETQQLEYNEKIKSMRLQEYPMLQNSTYLDHAGTTLYSKSLVEEFSKDLMENMFGNSHSFSSSSLRSSKRIENVRMRLLRLFNASAEHFELVFVANATAGMKLVADSLRELEAGFWYGYHKDAHTSLVGVRELASQHRCFGSDEDVEKWLSSENAGDPVDNVGVGLFAYPAQSNMNGRRLPLEWSGKLRNSSHIARGKIFSLLDAAALVSTSPIDLGDPSIAPDFTVLSAYKMFGLPDIGALIVRKEAGPMLLHRRYFGGGTVEMVACLDEQWHIKKDDTLHEQLEDGTLPIHTIIALDNALNVHERLFESFEHISRHVTFLANVLYEALRRLHHSNGTLVCDIYRTSSLQSDPNQIYGPIVSFNLRDGQGAWISNAEIEKLAAIKDIHLRTGNLCNPGGIASSLNLTSMQLKKFFASGHRCGNENDIIGGNPTGMTRVSLGAMSTLDDVRTLVDFLKEFFVDRNVTPSVPHSMHDTSHSTTFYIESLVIYPIKSCGGWRVPHGSKWDIKPEGLAWDREWCLVHRGSRAALSQKRYPKMAMLKPSFDFDAGILHVRYCGSTPPSVDNEIIIPLLSDPSLFHAANPADVSTCSRVCGERIQVQIYASPTITQFFSIVLGVPCHLARFPPEGSGPSLRHSKPDLASTKMSPHRSTPPHPILLSNDSPILTISRSSLNSLNEAIKSQSAGGKAASADVFRANIIIAEDPSFAPGIERPFIEDTWRFMEIDSAADAPRSGGTGERGTGTVLEVLGKCRRCHMVCVDQGTGERNEEPFVTLAKTRRVDGKVYFGVHMGILGGAACIQAGDRVQGIGDMEV